MPDCYLAYLKMSMLDQQCSIITFQVQLKFNLESINDLGLEYLRNWLFPYESNGPLRSIRKGFLCVPE